MGWEIVGGKGEEKSEAASWGEKDEPAPPPSIFSLFMSQRSSPPLCVFTFSIYILIFIV